MAHVPTEAEINEMSEEELEAYLDGSQPDEARPEPDDASLPAWLRATGARASYAWLLVVGSAIGLFASFELMLSELKHLKDPMDSLSCDVNPFVSCSASLDAWQGNLLGVPNAFIGGMAYAVLAALGLLLACGGRLPRWFWWGLVAGTVGALVFVAWFVAVSVTVFGALCPYCMLVWAVTIPMAWATWGEAAAQGNLPLGARAAARLSEARWWGTGTTVLVIVVVVLVRFWDGFVRMIG